ncbi:hypothetical protein [Nannocystis bainbridge]|uniref:Lipoprotein n=1 Tax=Nannocystis bainbridge TaxID=2995303 RepID=A0ABT5E395_9BACT|nr:hypothetical protein [Nannocystis bainbridge]MDC0720341.1 hypothetical protein [Nannocystis bainbridge]
MTKSTLTPFALSLAVLFACNPDKNPIDSTTDAPDTGSSGTDSSASEPTASEPTGPDPSSSTTEGDITTTAEPGETETTGTNGEAPACIDTPTVIAADAETPLGVTAEAFLADKLGPRETLLTFAEEPLSLSDAWRGVSLPLTVEVRYDAGEVRWIDSELNPDYEGEGFPSDCADRLEIDVGFDFVTEGLEFDEHRDGVLQLFDPASAQLRVELLPPGVNGSFDPATLYKADDPQWIVTGIEIGATLQGPGLGGSLLNEVKVGEEDGFVGFGNVASWGDPINP